LYNFLFLWKLRCSPFTRTKNYTKTPSTFFYRLLQRYKYLRIFWMFGFCDIYSISFFEIYFKFIIISFLIYIGPSAFGRRKNIYHFLMYIPKNFPPPSAAGNMYHFWYIFSKNFPPPSAAENIYHFLKYILKFIFRFWYIFAFFGLRPISFSNIYVSFLIYICLIITLVYISRKCISGMVHFYKSEHAVYLYISQYRVYPTVYQCGDTPC